MKSMVASHRGTARLTSKLLVLGLCLGFHTSQARAQDEGNPTPAEPTESATDSSTPSVETPTDATPPAEAAPTEEKKTEEGDLGDKIKEKVKELKKSRAKNRKETTDAVLKRRDKDPETAKYVMLGEAQTLPEKVARFRYVHRIVDGSESFDNDGTKKDMGIDALVKINAYVLEYGFSDKLSFQLLVPTIASSDVTINAEKFSKSKIYAKEYQEVMDKVVPFLISQGQCTSVDDCRNKIDNEAYAIPTDASLVLPTGEIYTVQGGIPVERAAYSLITNAVKPKKGKTGLSDIMVAALYNAYNSKLQMFSVGAGFRLPTGEGDDEKSYNRTGSGFTTFGLSLRYDFRITDPLMLSISNQTEVHVKNAHRKRHSLLDPDLLNEADTTTAGADLNPALPGEGDGVSNNYEVSRKVPLNTGSIRLAYALGDLSSVLAPLSIYGYYNWHSDPETFHDKEAQQNGVLSTSYSYSLAFDGLSMNPRIPASLSVTQDRYLTGKNVLVAGVSTSINLLLYYKF
jgi:hypothetical protein